MGNTSSQIVDGTQSSRLEMGDEEVLSVRSTSDGDDEVSFYHFNSQYGIFSFDNICLNSDCRDFTEDEDRCGSAIVE